MHCAGRWQRTSKVPISFTQVWVEMDVSPMSGELERRANKSTLDPLHVSTLGPFFMRRYMGWVVDNWFYWDGENKNWKDDPSLTLEFTSLSPCHLVRVKGKGGVVKKEASSLGKYRS